ncbi:ADP-ribosyltransferase [Campylobacter jejuni]|uniref:ADP-ribosyltransferase n=1 Tax=Campylobacter jejuni TaxID=197 RepID=UPI003B991EDF
MKKIFFLFMVFGFGVSLLAYDDTGYRKFQYGAEAVNWWKRLYSDKVLSKEEKSIVYQYTFGDFVVINDKLRKGIPLSSLNDEQKDMVKRLDKALGKTIIFENLIVYRYENLGFLFKLLDISYLPKIYQNGKFTEEAKHYLESIIHKKYRDYGFMSTTAIKNSVFQTRPIELVIKVPKYSDTLFVSLKDLAAFETQYELLFPRNRVLTIERYEISKDFKRLTIFVKMTGPCYAGKPCEIEKVDNLKQPPEF